MSFGLHEVWIYHGEWPDVCFGRCAFGAEGGHHKLTGGLLWCPTFFGLEKPSVFNDCRKWHKWHRKQKTKVCNLDFSMTADDCHSNYRWCFMSAAPAGEVQKSCQVSIFKTVIYWPGQPCLEVSGMSSLRMSKVWSCSDSRCPPSNQCRLVKDQLFQRWKRISKMWMSNPIIVR